MPESTSEAAENRLLARLPPEKMERLPPHLGRVSFALGEAIRDLLKFNSPGRTHTSSSRTPPS